MQRSHGCVFVPRTSGAVPSPTSAGRALSVRSDSLSGGVTGAPGEGPSLGQIVSPFVHGWGPAWGAEATGCRLGGGGGQRTQQGPWEALPEAGSNTSQRPGPPPCGRKGFCPMFTRGTQTLKLFTGGHFGFPGRGVSGAPKVREYLNTHVWILCLLVRV